MKKSALLLTFTLIATMSLCVISCAKTEEPLQQGENPVTPDEVVSTHEMIPGSNNYILIFLRSNKEIARQEIAFTREGNSFGPKVVSMTGHIPDGIVRSYYPGGELRSETNYKDDKEHGLAKSYYKSGALEVELSYTDGKKDGVMKTFYESGAVAKEFNYTNDILSSHKGYYEDGSLKYEMDMSKGIFNLYDESGNLFPPEKVTDNAFMANFLK